MPSNKILSEKQELVRALAEKLGSSTAGVLVDYKGTNVVLDTEMRRKMRDAGVEYAVIKNTMIRFATADTALDGLHPFLEGPTALAIHKDDPVAAAKMVHAFMGKDKPMQVKAGFVDGRVITAAEVEALSKLPAKEVLVAQVLGTMIAPITGLATVLNANIRGLAVALQAIADKKSA
ncbi:MAG: 50S ribosomal protein L10 [Oscillospiraceae bacterium]|nr:50S ribosomal protein L10 [Oscillospiraceae bacterium]